MSLGHRWGAAASLAALLLFAAPPEGARAYCRQGVETDAGGDCEETPGVPLLYWSRSCIAYEFHEEFFQRFEPHGFSESELRFLFQNAFESWRSVECPDGRDPFRVFQLDEVSSADKARFEYDVENEFVISARDLSEWISARRAPTALAITLVWHNPETGEIFDVDIDIHADAGVYGVCDSPCEDRTIDLLNAVTHEAGHVLGLGHSKVQESTMFKHSEDGENSKRSLEQDDRDGLCSLELPPHDCQGAGCVCPAPPVISSSVTTGGCSLAHTTGGARGSAVAWLWLPAALLSLVGWRRRRRP